MDECFLGVCEDFGEQEEKGQDLQKSSGFVSMNILKPCDRRPEVPCFASE